MNTSWRTASLVATAASVLALTTACGQDNTTTPASAAQNVGATAAAGNSGNPGSGTVAGAGNGYGADGSQSSASPAPVAPRASFSVAGNPELGDVLTDGSGLTLYRFDKDTANPPKSNCADDCATTWPPVPAEDATAGAGIDKALPARSPAPTAPSSSPSTAGPPTATPRTSTPVTSTARAWAAGGSRSPLRQEGQAVRPARSVRPQGPQAG